MGKKAVKFALLTMPRSGTNYFVEKLEYHKYVMCHYEPFHPDKVILSGKRKGFPEDIWFKLQNQKFRTYEEDLYFDYLLGQDPSILLGYKAYGFKIFETHNKRIFWSLAADPEFHILILQRKNFLKLYSSYLIALKSNVWSVYHEKDKNKSQKVLFDPEDYTIKKKAYDNLYLHLKHLTKVNKVPHMHLYYEDVVQNDNVFHEVFEFLKVGSTKLPEKTKIVKQNQSDVLARFSNPDVVRKHIPEPELAEYLNL